MAKESVRKCSHCGQNGHNSRTCNGKGCFKLFGVKINLNEKELDENTRKSNFKGREDEFIRKSKSLGDLQAYKAEPSAVDVGYLSDGLIHSDRAKAAHERNKGVTWSEEEHRSFSVGLKKLGKGDWRGISKNFVASRTPTQVASHAQKYFIRMAAIDRKKRRSLFDMHFNSTLPPQPQASLASPSNKAFEISQQASTSTHVATSERPPVSPVARTYGIPNFHHMPYMMGVSSNGQSFPAAKVMPTVPFVPMMNFPNPGYVYLPNSHGNFATCASFMSLPWSSLLPQPRPQGPFQAGPAICD